MIVNFNNNVIRKLEPYGNLGYELMGSESAIEIFRILWKHSTEFCVVNTKARAIQIDSAKHKIARIRRSFDEYSSLKKSIIEAIWAQQWPGTTSEKPDRLLIIGSTKTAEFDSLFKKNTNIFWCAGNEWEDLILMNKSHILFYVCSHEAFGEIFGDERLFKNLNLLAKPFKKNCILEINGIRIGSELFNKFIGNPQK